LAEAAGELEGFLRNNDPVLNADHELAVVLTDRAGVFRQDRHWDEAEKVYRQALAVRREITSRAEKGAEQGFAAASEAQLQAEVGHMFLEAGFLPRAAVEFSEAAKERSGFQGVQLLSPGLLNDIAWFFMTCPDAKLHDPSLAVRLAQKAVEVSRDAGPAWNTLGVARYRAGDWKGAIEGLTHSVERRNGGDSFDFFFLAMGNWQLGEKEQARTWYGKAVEWMDKNKPQDEELRRFRAEAAELLGIEKQPQGNKKESPRSDAK
jgi:tetratricopeptide (TPR) repeat protein